MNVETLSIEDLASLRAFRKQWAMPDMDFIRDEIDRMRGQVAKQRKEILQLQRAGISTAQPSFCLFGCWPRSTPIVTSGTN